MARRITRRGPHAGVIIFIPHSAIHDKTDWAITDTEVPGKQCPICLTETIIGHGRRRKQAHDEDHDWICIRRGICKLCGTTFTFLPLFSPPYGHYSWIARSHALYDYFLAGKSLESAAPLVKDPDRLAAPSTLRRWFRDLDSPELCRSFEELRPACNRDLPAQEPIVLREYSSFPFLEKILQIAKHRVTDVEFLPKGTLTRSWENLAPFLQFLLPLRC